MKSLQKDLEQFHTQLNQGKCQNIYERFTENFVNVGCQQLFIFPFAEFSPALLNRTPDTTLSMATMHYYKIGLIALSTILALFSPAFPLNFSELLILHAIAQTTNNTHSDKTLSANSASVGSIIDYFAQESQFKGHNGSVNSASFSPDSKLIVTASADKTVRVWDFSGKQLAELVGHQNSVKSAKFSPDSKLIVTASSDGTARLWNLSGNQFAQLQGHQGYVYNANFSPDGKRIITAGADKTVRLWDLSGKQIVDFKAHEGSVYAVSFSPDGKRIVTAGADNIGRVWDLSGKLLAELKGHTDTVWSASFSPDGKRIVTASDDKTARVWDLSGTQLAILQGHQDSVYSASFSPDGKRIVTASVDFTGLIWESSGKLVGKLQQHIGGVNSASWSPDGKWIVTASNDGTAKLWDASSKLFTTLHGHRGSIVNTSFSPDGKWILTASNDRTTKLWDTSSKLIAELKGWQSASFSADSKRILTVLSKTVRVWNTSGKLLLELQHQSLVTSASFSPNGKLIVTASNDGTNHVWDTAGKPLIQLRGKPGYFFQTASFSPDGKLIMTASSKGKIARVWDTRGKLLVELQHPGSAIFSPDSRLIVTTGDRAARVWDTRGKLLVELQHPGYVRSAIFSPDGRLIMTISNDKTARVWGTNGKLLFELKAERHIAHGNFSRDGKLILTGSWNQTTLWDKNGKLLAELPGGHANFSPDSKRIIASFSERIGNTWISMGLVWYLSNKQRDRLRLPETPVSAKVQLQQKPKGKGFLKGSGYISTATFSPDNQLIVTTSGLAAQVWDTSGKLLVELKGHQDTVNSASFSPDGKLIMTASSDKTARVWDISGKLLVELKGHQNTVNGASFSPNGKLIVTTSGDKTARVWDTSGKLLTELKSEGSVTSASFSPDSKLIVTATSMSFDSARVWDINGKLLAELGHKNQLNSASFSPNGKLIVTGTFGAANVWDTSGKLLVELKVPNQNVWNASFSPDSKLIVTGGSNDARVWDTNGKQLAEFKVAKFTKFKGSQVKSASFSLDGKRIFTVSSKAAQVWDTNGKLLAEFQGDYDNFSSDGKLILTASRNGNVGVWDTNRKLLAELKARRYGVKYADFSPDGERILTVSDDSIVRIWDKNSKLLSEFQGKGASFSPDGKLVIIPASYKNNQLSYKTARVLDTARKFLFELQDHQDTVSSASFSPDGKLIVTVVNIFTGSSNGIFKVFDTFVQVWDTNGKLLTKFQKDKNISFSLNLLDRNCYTIVGMLEVETEMTHSPVNLSPDSKRIVAPLDRSARVWDTNGKLLAELKGHQGCVTSASFSPDGKRIVTTALDGARVWDTNGKLVAELKGHQDSVLNASFSPDNKLIATLSRDGIAILWDFTGKQLAQLNGYNYKIKSLSFSPSSQLILTASDDGIARIWDTSGERLAQFKGHLSNINDAVFSPDGKLIATASDDGTARVWNLSGKELANLGVERSIPATPKAEADRLRDLEFEAPNCAAALPPWQQALEIYKEITDYENQAVILEKLGNVYYCLGDYTNTIKSYNEALTAAQKFKSLQLQVKNIANLGDVYNTLADYETAIQKYDEALKILPQENSETKAKILQGRGKVYNSQGKLKEAIRDYEQALAIDNASGIAENKVNLANIYVSLGDTSKAIQYYKEALPIKPIEGLAGLGNVYLSFGEVNKAIDYYQQSLIQAKQREDKEGEGNALNNLGFALYKLGKFTDAEKNLRAAIEVWENLRTKLDDTNKVSIFEKQARTYRLLQQVLIDQNKIEEALEISERGRARAFVDLLSQRLSPNQEEELRTPQPDIKLIKEIARVHNSTLVQYSIITDDFNVDGNLKTQESNLYIWIVKPTGEVIFRKSDLKPLWQNESTNLSQLVNSTRLSIGVVDLRSRQAGGIVVTGKGTDEITQSKRLKRLHELLIQPIADTLSNHPDDRIVFIPQGSLFLVPFPALQDTENKYLVEKHTILTAPSIQVLDLTHQQRQILEKRNLTSLQHLVVGNPTMPSVSLKPGEEPKTLPPLLGAQQEALAIAPMLNTKAIVGSAATETAIAQKMPNAKIIHLATHGLFDDLRGLGSALALTPSVEDNGLLSAEEILKLKLNADLVVLSACDTGRGRITGDGVIGLSRSFISAGVPSIVVSLWSVGDNSTAFLMTEFYKNMQQGLDKATALRKAMLATKEKYSNPLQWAAFTLIGEAE